MSPPLSPTLTDMELLSMSSEPDSPSPHSCKPVYTRHTKHYVYNLIVLQVGNYLYRVSAAVLRSFAYFQGVLGTPSSGPYEGLAGSTDALPLVLPDIKSADMDCLLDILEARCLQGHDHITFQQWAGALHLATRWDSEALKTFIISHMNDAIAQRDPFECIDIATTYQVDTWLTQACTILCERPESLTREEGNRLGMERALAIMSVRVERAKAGPDTKFDTAAMISQDKILGAPLSQNGPASHQNLSSSPERHPKYYQSGLVVLVVANTLYHVSHALFSESTKIRDLLRGSSETSDELPLELRTDGATTDADFGDLLDVIDAKLIDGQPELSFQQLAAALSLATDYNLATARNHTIHRMELQLRSQPPIDVIEIARRNDVPSWLTGCYIALCERSEVLSDAEAERLGLPCCIAVSRVRERIATMLHPKKGGKGKYVRKEVLVPPRATIEWIREEPTLVGHLVT